MKVIKAKLTHRTHHKLDIKLLTIGDVLVYDIYIKRDDDYVILIKAGTKVSSELYEKLKKRSSLYISASDEYKKIFNSKSLFNYIKYNKSEYKKSFDYLYKITNELFTNFSNSNDYKFDIPILEDIIKSIIYLVQSDNAYLQKTIPFLNDAHELKYHSLHVATYAISLGHTLKFTNKELLELGIAGFMHDLGMKNINEDIINKNSKLDLDELELMQQHCKYSSDIAKKNYVHDPYILDAIMHHHEALDGSGYPNQINSQEISQFAAILSITDNFDALTSSRPYRKKYSTFEALTIMMKEDSMANKFNQEYLKVFLASLVK